MTPALMARRRRYRQRMMADQGMVMPKEAERDMAEEERRMVADGWRAPGPRRPPPKKRLPK